MDTQVTLDYLHDNWVMVLGEDVNCNQGGQPARMLGTWVLQPQPDDTLTGTWTEITTGPDCPFVVQMPVKVSRHGDAPEGVEVADPASVPARKPSKADGFNGPYAQSINTRPPSADTATIPVEVATFCVRNTEECASPQASNVNGSSQMTPLTITDGRGAYKFNRGDAACDNDPAAMAQRFGYDELLIPDAAPNPIPSLSGTRRLEMLEPCPDEAFYDLTYQRGDVPPPGAPPAPVEPAPAPPPAPGG